MSHIRFLVFVSCLHSLLQATKAAYQVTSDALISKYCLNEKVTLNVTLFMQVVSKVTETDSFVICIEDEQKHKLKTTALFNYDHTYPFSSQTQFVNACDLNETTFEDIYFVKNESIYLRRLTVSEKIAPKNGVWSFLGFNQVWLGCPQPFCFMAEVDAAVSSVRTVLISRGKHICKLRILAGIDRLKPPKASDCIEDEVAFFDYGLFMDSKMYLVKGTTFRMFNKDGVIQKDQQLTEDFRLIFESNTKIDVDAAFANDYKAFIYSGHKIIVHTLGREFTEVVEYNYSTPDAAIFLRTDFTNVYLFTGSQVYVSEFEHKASKPPNFWRRPTPTHTTFFDCGEVYKNSVFKTYTGFVKYLEQFKDYKIPVENGKPVDGSVTRTTSDGFDENDVSHSKTVAPVSTEYLVITSLIVIFVLLLTIGILVTYHVIDRNRKKNKKLKNDKASKS